MASTALIATLLTWPVHQPLSEPSDTVVDLLAGVKLGEAVGRIVARPVVVEGPAAIRNLICSYVDWDCATAIRIATCESTLRPGAVSPGGHLGVFQMSPIHAWRVGGDPARLLNAADNIRAAHGLYVDSGRSWAPWSCR